MQDQYLNGFDDALKSVPIVSAEYATLERERDQLKARVTELEKALRDVSIVDLGFSVPRYFCAACASYGNGPESIEHKTDCVTARTLALMAR